MGDFADYQEILRTYNPVDIAMVKSLLDHERIDYFFRGEFFGYAYPWTQPARLAVRREQAFLAREILRDLKLSYSVSSMGVRAGDSTEGGRRGVIPFPGGGVKASPRAVSGGRGVGVDGKR